MDGQERRELRDPKALRALAHPVRLRVLEELALSGPLTATELGDRTGQTPSNCSWHLRQLAQYGFVEEAGGGSGRQRPWRMVLRPNSWGSGELEPEEERAGEALTEVVLTRELEQLLAALARARGEPPPWRDAAFVSQSLAWMTADELKATGEEMNAIMLRYFDRAGDPQARPAAARPIRLMAWGITARPIEGKN